MEAKMTPKEFEDGLKLIGWRQIDFAQATGTTPVTVNHWIKSVTPLPQWAIAHIELLMAMHKHLAPPSRAKKMAEKLAKEKPEN